MSDNSNFGSGGGSDEDDLLSQLLDLDDEKPQKKVSSPSQEGEGFDLPTSVHSDDRTEVLLKDSSADLSKLDFSEENDRTEVLQKKPSSVDVEENDLLGQLLDDDSGLDDQTEFLMQGDAEHEKLEEVDSQKDSELAAPADFLDQALFEETKLEENKTDDPFASFGEESQNIGAEETDSIKEDLFGGGTLLLDNPLPEEQAQPDAEAEIDPIDAALADYAASNEGLDDHSSKDLLASTAQSQEDKNSADASSGLSSLMQSLGDNDPVHAATSELSEEDFADVFKTGPIQVPDEPRKSSSTFSKQNLKKISGGFAALFVFGAVGFFGWKFTQDEGLLGYRLDGFQVTASYRAPSAEAQERYQAILKKAEELVFLDEPEKLSAFLPQLNQILLEDPRHYMAASTQLEILGILMNWEGVKGSYPAQYDQVLQQINAMTPFLKGHTDSIVQTRAKAWRSAAVGEYLKSLEELQSLSTAPDQRTLALKAELAFRSGDLDRAKSWSDSLKESPLRRAQYFSARSLSDDKKLRQLASDDYLPAMVWKKIEQSASENSSQRKAALDSLLSKVEKFPWLEVDVRVARGEAFAAAGQSELAREDWRKVVELSPNEFQAWVHLARSYEQDNLWDDAISAYQAALKIGGLRKLLALQYISILRTRLKVVDALDMTEKAIQKYPDIPDFYFEKGETQLTINRLDEAKESFSKALELDPRYERATLSLASIALQQEEWTEAEKLFQSIKESSPNYSNALTGLGNLAFGRRDLNSAKKFYALAIRSNSKNVQALSKLNNLLLRSEEDSKALALVEQAIQESPQSVELRMAKARIFQFQEKPDLGLKEIESFTDSYSHLESLQLLKADLEIDSKQFDSAISTLEKFQNSQSRNPEVYYLLAKAHYAGYQPKDSALNSNEMAWRHLESLHRLNPHEEKYLELRAKVGLIVQERQAAVEAIEKIVRDFPDNATALSLRGDLRNYEGNIELAKVDYLAALKKTRFKGEIYRKLAQTFSTSGETEQAIDYWKKVASYYPRDAGAFLELGKMFNEQGNFMEAKRSFQKAIARDPKLADPYYYLGFLEKDLGESGQAVKNFEKYLQLNPQGIESATVQDEIFFLKNSGISN